MADDASLLLGLSSKDISAGLGAAGSLFGGVSNFLADDASAEGYKIESQAYSQAAGYAAGNVNLAEEAKAIRMFQTERQIAATIGQAEAGIGANGFQLSGSGLDIIRSSMQQGALARGLVNVQGELQAQGYRAQEAQDTALAKQASEAASAAESKGPFDIIGGILGAGAKILPLL